MSAQFRTACVLVSLGLCKMIVHTPVYGWREFFRSWGGSFQNYFPIFSEKISASFTSSRVFFCMALATKQLEVVKVQSDLGTINVLGSQLLDVMHDHTGTIDATLQALLA